MNFILLLILFSLEFFISTAVFPGYPIRKELFPFSAAISIIQTNRKEIRASGALISLKCVITAANPFEYFQSGHVTVGIAKTDIYYDDDRQHEPITHIHKHPLYDGTISNAQNNLAIVVLKRKINWERTAKPLAMPSPTFFDYTDSDFDVVGWGQKSVQAALDAQNTDDHLIYGNGLNVQGYAMRVSNVECSDEYFNLGDQDSKSLICAYSQDSDNRRSLCDGDEGAPLVKQVLPNNSNYTLIGVAVYFNCTLSRAPLYARISEQLEWISSFIEVSSLHNNDSLSHEPNITKGCFVDSSNKIQFCHH